MAETDTETETLEVPESIAIVGETKEQIERGFQEILAGRQTETRAKMIEDLERYLDTKLRSTRPESRNASAEKIERLKESALQLSEKQEEELEEVERELKKAKESLVKAKTDYETHLDTNNLREKHQALRTAESTVAVREKEVKENTDTLKSLKTTEEALRARHKREVNLHAQAQRSFRTSVFEKARTAWEKEGAATLKKLQKKAEKMQEKISKETERASRYSPAGGGMPTAWAGI